MSFFQRLVSYVINDVAVKALSNSRAFQRFALKTHYHVEDAKTMASTGAGALKNGFETYAPKVKEFGEAFREEVARDLKKMKRSWKKVAVAATSATL
ncbi:hypothetical protein PF007_g12332 [Phytophthora fragariae]|uniref:Uncharacterized protein n=4 Tax=Phytophthora TaxID=4783 RepID=A0A6A4DIN3_9STRA|nr:hypothetical protein PF009_g13272 [Phytophthora fragariae]KAE9027992.1 hypothetical protein PR002_g10532 [Phytophthora rubi]KAE9032873.1 hypothetical protein PR001_g10409 [Phytophthora rubi]KAE9109215.1 hypothetical protein PF007_g12332 [Phytophthora fragariae]KAE9143661.1 hypothetical protein PF006_g11337 [Phytophthora fragariae]